jgi:hypothetical protein
LTAKGACNGDIAAERRTYRAPLFVVEAAAVTSSRVGIPQFMLKGPRILSFPLPADGVF